MEFGLTAVGRAAALLVAVLVSGCSTIYTSPGVSDGSVFGMPDTDLKIAVVPMSFESTTAANLTPYIPARLPLGFQPDAISRSVGVSVPQVSIPALPAAATRPGPRPGFIPDRIPPLVAPRPYRIGVADVLLLSVNAANATLEQLPGLLAAQSKRQGFVVQDDGAIAIPDVGRVSVAGLTVQDAESAIFQAIVRAGIDPSFSLEIAEFNSQRVSVGGQVNSPTLVPITLKTLYLNEALNAAGGIAVTDPKVARIQIFRGGQTYQFTVERFLSDPALSQIVLVDGDSIYVISDFSEDRARAAFGERLQLSQQILTNAQFRAQLEAQALQVATARQDLEMRRYELERSTFEKRLELGAVKRDYAYLAGEVKKVHRLELPFENKAVLADLLFGESGGIDIKTGDYGAIYVLRRSTNPAEASGVTAYHLDAGNATNLALASMFELHAGDVVFVAEQPVTAWNRVVSQILPQLFLSAANLAS